MRAAALALGVVEPTVELHAHSAYSFLDGASLPEELAARAAELGYDALALTDHDGVYGSLEFAHAAKHFGVRPITGAEVRSSAARTSRCSARPSTATRISAGSSPTRMPDARAREGARPAAGRDEHRRRSSSTPKGSSCSPAARGTGSGSSIRTARRSSRARSRARSTSSSSARTSAATPAGTRGCTSSRRRWASRRSRPATSTLTTRAGAAAGRTRRDQEPHVARRLRTRAARQPRVGAALAGGDARASAARCGAAHA